MFCWNAGSAVFEMDESGKCRLTTSNGGGQAEQAGCLSPIAHICIDGTLHAPVSARVSNGIVKLDFNIASASIEITDCSKHLRLSVAAIDDSVDEWIWGPFQVNRNVGYGEVIGVVWDDDFAIGLQALNPKTAGGFPEELVDRHPFAGMIPSRKGQREQNSTCAALPLEQGAALLQAFARNRTRPAKRDFFYAKQAIVLPVSGNDAGIPGSAIALFGCPRSDILMTIGEIELAEGLPHPVIDGEWAKTARKANASYLITDFAEDTFAEALAFTKAAGLECVYHPDPFQNWGHFELKEACFPHGEAGMKTCVEEAAREGIHVGIHTLSNFTTTNDPYVTPTPHPSLLKMGGTALLKSIDETSDTIAIADNAFFTRLSTLNAVRIGDELIRYTRMEKTDNGFVLVGCERGAWATLPSRHDVGSDVFRLWDYDYRTLFPDVELQREYSRRLGELFNQTGIRRVSFDGLEGCAYTGHGEFANSRFVQDCYDAWGPDVRSDASGLSHYRWHLHSYMNWGEPWYADMRNGMFDYRKNNQAYFKRNLLPPMMGWYTMRLATRKYEAMTVDDMEWMLSKAAGFGAGFAFAANMGALRSHGLAMECLGRIKAWEPLRLSDRLPDDLREQMRDPKSEWHVEEQPDGWLVHRMTIALYECSPEGAQPGMPSGADWMTYNPYPDQKMVFRLRAGDQRDRGAVVNPTFRVGEEFISFRARIEAGQYLVYGGGTDIRICDPNFNVVQTVAGDGLPLRLANGIGMLLFKCTFEGEEPPYPQVKVFMMDNGRFISNS